MSDATSVTAQIIPFPLRRPVPATNDSRERLKRALAGLDEAVAEQRAAVAKWRGSLAELSTVVSRLGAGLQCYRGHLDTLSTRVARLHTQAVLLERTAGVVSANRADCSVSVRHEARLST
jgi:hypothetical protein